MPTALPRLQVTETPAVTRAIEVAARRWPEITSRSALLAALAEEGVRAVQEDDAERRAARRHLVESLAGGFDDVYYDGYLEELREDWPQ